MNIVKYQIDIVQPKHATLEHVYAHAQREGRREAGGTWQSFKTTRSWSWTLLQITEPWIKHPSSTVTWFITTELTICNFKEKYKPASLLWNWNGYFDWLTQKPEQSWPRLGTEFHFNTLKNNRSFSKQSFLLVVYMCCTFTFEPILQWRPMTDRFTLHLSPNFEPSASMHCGPT